MLTLRKLLNKPKLTDNRPLAVFYYCDESVNHQMQELNYLMRTAPDNLDRRATLIKQLKESQHNLMNVIFAIIQEAIPEYCAVRDFRAKYPDDVLVDQINGPLWFGAECIAAGSHILNHELESEELRPFAMQLSKAISRVRMALKEQCLTNREVYPQKLKDMLQAFDAMWTDFEFRYVGLMCNVKSERQYYHQQDIIVLFCESTLRALKKEYINHEMIETMDPSIMFAIPRLAIVCGLAVYPEGPLDLSKPAKEMPSFFRGYRTLLGRIKELLGYLTEDQLTTLERALCSSEGLGSLHSIQQLQSNLTQRPLSIPTESLNTGSIVTPFSSATDLPPSTSPSPSSSSSSTSSSSSSPSSHSRSNPSSPNLSNRCLAAATPVSHHRSHSLGSHDLRTPTLTARQHTDLEVHQPVVTNSDLTAASVRGGVSIQREGEAVVREENSSFPQLGPDQPVINDLPTTTSLSRRGQPNGGCGQTPISSLGINTEKHSSPSSSPTTNTKHSPRQSRRGSHHSKGPAGFASAEDLMHRLFVAISGVADQLQTNHAKDLRVILKHVFCVCQSEPESLEEEGDKCEGGRDGDEDPLLTESEPSFAAFSTVERIPFATTSLSSLSSWVPDRECLACASCHENFTWKRRKHHCRSCGQVVCGRCSPNTLPVPHLGQYKSARVCTSCYLQQLGEVVRLSASHTHFATHPHSMQVL